MAATTQQSYLTRKKRTQRRYEKVKEAVNYKYCTLRKRFDDVINEVAEEFDYSELTVKRILNK